ncbi:hypothetical protein [Cetobacterium sp. SF1]|uniref:hypothetical protein n=1 Tax=unclassified Cetobacterium TaxID=2630983 RepID=UPI003CE75DB9
MKEINMVPTTNLHLHNSVKDIFNKVPLTQDEYELLQLKYYHIYPIETINRLTGKSTLKLNEIYNKLEDKLMNYLLQSDLQEILKKLSSDNNFIDGNTVEGLFKKIDPMYLNFFHFVPEKKILIPQNENVYLIK